MNTKDGQITEGTAIKQDRVHLRLDAKSKRKLERAATYEETTVSRFVITNAVAAAERIIDAHEKIVLSTRDWDAFHAALLHPPEPNETLRTAARRHKHSEG